MTNKKLDFSKIQSYHKTRTLRVKCLQPRYFNFLTSVHVCVQWKIYLQLHSAFTTENSSVKKMNISSFTF
jgi:hypothetical protein